MPATEFTPLASLAGGALIGLSAAIYLLALGRIAGVSGIVAQLLPPADRLGQNASKSTSNIPTSLAFVIGLLLGAPLIWIVTGSVPGQTVMSNIWLVVAAGLLVGFGSILGNGCTSGHGVCGISRVSARSIIATITFMFSGAVTVYILRHVVVAS